MNDDDFEKSIQRYQKAINDADPIFLNNVLMSIKKVIAHFNHESSAFVDISVEKLLHFNKMSDISYLMRIESDPNYVREKYEHTFSYNYFGTLYISMPSLFFNLFKKYNSENSCSIRFTDDGHIKDIEFKAGIKSNENKIITLTYDQDFKLNRVSRAHVVKNIKTPKNVIVNIKSYVGNEVDEFYFLELFLKGAGNLVAELPEFSIPSAYDFNSETFKHRLTIAEMLLV